MNNSRYEKKSSVEGKEISDLARTVREVEYLVLLLVILYVVVPGTALDNRPLVIFATIGCTLAILVLHYFFYLQSRQKVALEAFLMTIFITFVLWHTGKNESPLISLYLIVVIYSALMLGRLTTLLLVGLITAVLLYFDYSSFSLSLFSMENATVLMMQLIVLYTLLLIAYLTIMIATQMEHTRNKIKMLSEQDELTGLYNMRAFSGLVHREHKKCERYPHSFAILMLDVDNLKNMNDKYGHLMGDRLLIFIANAMRKNLRTTDNAARYGGDEFIALLPQIDEQGAIECAQRIKNHVEVTPFWDENGVKLYSSISVGIACFPIDASEPEALVGKADKALYFSKRQGKNSISLAREMPLETV